MLKRIMTGIITAAVLITSQAPAFAVDINAADVKIEIDGTGTVTVTGHYDYFYDPESGKAVVADADRMITLTAQTGDEENNEIKSLNQFTADESGDFSFKFFIISKPVDITFTLTDRMSGQYTETKRFDANPCSVFNYIKASKKAADMAKYLDCFGDEISFDFDAYGLLTSENKNKVTEEIFKLPDVSSMEELISASQGLGLTNLMFSTAEEPEVILNYIEKKLTKEGEELNSPVGKFFDEILSDEQKAAIVNSYMGTTNYSFADFKSKTIKRFLADAADYTQMAVLIEDYHEACGFDEQALEDYGKLNDKFEVQRAMFSLLPVEDTDDFVSKFKVYVEKQKKAEAALGKNSSGGSSGGRSSGGGSTYSIPAEYVNVSSGKTDEGLPFAFKFTDLDDVPWAEEAISALTEQGIVNGVTETEFRPGENITREQFTKLLMMGLRMTGVEAEVKCFEDVSESDWYYSSVAAAFRADIIRGVSDTAFGVGMPISREDMAVMIYRAVTFRKKSLNNGEEVEFRDSAEIAGYARDAVAKLADSGLIRGTGEGNFSPKKHLTRAEAAKVIYGLLKILNLIK